MSNKIAVIGLGNTLRRDDGIGIIVLASLLKLYNRPDIDYLDFGTASFDLIHRIKDYDKVLLIDAIDAMLQPAQLKIFRLDEVDYNLTGPAISSHELNLKGIFELYKNLGFKSEVYVAGIQVKDVSFGGGLSEELGKRLMRIAEKIDCFISGLKSVDNF